MKNRLAFTLTALLLAPLFALHAAPAEDSVPLDQGACGTFMQRKDGESIVTVTVGGKRVLYDFDKAAITEANSPKRSTEP